MIKTNFHTHTIFCDGKNTPEEMVVAAIEKGFCTIGFSGHSYFEPEADISMSIDAQKEYIKQVNELKEKYSDKIEIFCGIEQDIFSDEPIFNYEYKIGSVHNIFKNGKYYDIDLSPESTKNTIDTVYNGDFDSFAEDYFSLVGDVLKVTNADIIGHIDLVSKFSETLGFSQSERFLKACENAIIKLVPYNKPFEINTGAMSRGWRTIPYPTPEILTLIKKHGGTIAFSSDCHNKDFLDFGFEKAFDLAISLGFDEHAIITKNGIKYIPIK